MKGNKKTTPFIIFLLSISVAVFIIMQIYPAEIVAVHKHNIYSLVLVKNFPLTNTGKIKWQLKNKHNLKRKFNIPDPSVDSDFTVIFWLFGDGYKEAGKYDRLCFIDMPPPVNCIDKEAIFSVKKDNSGVIFATYDGHYSMNKDGKISKIDNF